MGAVHPNRVAVFVDEIELTKQISFSLDFFMAIKSIYNQRPRDQESYRSRLSFVLVGLSRPEDLISANINLSPLNPDVVIELTDFTVENAAPLVDALPNRGTSKDNLTRWVLESTGGHPYLTQLVCYQLSKNIDPVNERSHVLQAVNAVIRSEDIQQKHLSYIKHYLVDGDDSDEKTAVLCLLWLILNKDKISDNNDRIIKLLKLSGIVKNEDGVLAVRNNIYISLIDKKWVEAELGKKGVDVAKGSLVVKNYAASIQNRHTKPSPPNTSSSDSSEIEPDMLQQQIAEIEELLAEQKLEEITHESILTQQETIEMEFEDENKVEVEQASDVQVEQENDEAQPDNRLLRNKGWKIDTLRLGTRNIPIRQIAILVPLVGLVLTANFITLVYFGVSIALLFFSFILLISVVSYMAIVQALTERNPERIGRYLDDDTPQQYPRPLPRNFFKRLIFDWPVRIKRYLLQFDKWLDEKLIGADISLRTNEFYFIITASTLIAGWVGYYIGGQSIAVSTELMFFLHICLYSYFVRRRINNAKAMDAVMQQTLTFMINALRSGFSELQAIQITAKEIGGQVGREFNRIIVDVQLGNLLYKSFNTLSKRVPSLGLAMMNEIITAFRESRGNLSDALEELRGHLRSIEKIEKMISDGKFPSFSLVYSLIFFVVFCQEKILPSINLPVTSNSNGSLVFILSLSFLTLASLIFSFACQLMDDASYSARNFLGDISIGILFCLGGYLIGFSQISLLWLTMILFSRSKLGLMFFLLTGITAIGYFMPINLIQELILVLMKNLFVGVIQLMALFYSAVNGVNFFNFQIVTVIHKFLQIDFGYLETIFRMLIVVVVGMLVLVFIVDKEN